jgi:hypothetical protein
MYEYLLFICRDVMILMRATSITRTIRMWWALKIEHFLGPEITTSDKPYLLGGGGGMVIPSHKEFRNQQRFDKIRLWYVKRIKRICGLRR